MAPGLLSLGGETWVRRSPLLPTPPQFYLSSQPAHIHMWGPAVFHSDSHLTFLSYNRKIFVILKGKQSFKKNINLVENLVPPPTPPQFSLSRHPAHIHPCSSFSQLATSVFCDSTFLSSENICDPAHFPNSSLWPFFKMTKRI